MAGNRHCRETLNGIELGLHEELHYGDTGRRHDERDTFALVCCCAHTLWYSRGPFIVPVE